MQNGPRGFERPATGVAALIVAALVGAWTLVACSSDGATGPTRRPASVVRISGDSQRVAVGGTAGAPLVARLLDEEGDPIAGVPVTWSIALEQAPPGATGDLASRSNGSDAEGLVRATYRADTVSGTARVAVSADGMATTFHVLIAPAPPHALEKIAGDAMTLPATGDGAVFVARVRDRYGNPVPAAEVKWTALGTRQDPALSAERDTSDAEGLVRVSVLPNGIAQSISLTAALTGPTAGEWQVEFRATAVSAQATLELAWATREVPNANLVSNDLRVRAFSADGKPVANVAVTVHSPTEGVEITGTTTETTDADGEAEFDDLIVRGGTPGDSIALIFEAADHEPMTVRAKVIEPGAEGIEIVSGDAQSVLVTRVADAQLVARLVDGRGRPVTGAPVAWATAERRTALLDPSTESDDAGLVRAGLVADTVAGAVEVVVAARTGGGQARFHIQIIPDAPAVLRRVAGNEQTFPLGEASAPFMAKIVDRYGNPTPGVEVVWSAAPWFAQYEATLSTVRDTTDTEGVVSTDLTVRRDEAPHGTRVWVDASAVATNDVEELRFYAWASTELGMLEVIEAGGFSGDVCRGVAIAPPIAVQGVSRTGEYESLVPVTVRTLRGGTLSGTMTELTILGTAKFDGLTAAGTIGDTVALVFEAPEYTTDSIHARLAGDDRVPALMVPAGPTFIYYSNAAPDVEVKVRLTDASGSGILCVPVRFSFGGTRDTIVTTNAEGIASYAGRGSSMGGAVTASYPGLESSPILFTIRFWWDPCNPCTLAGDRAASRPPVGRAASLPFSRDTSGGPQYVERVVAAMRRSTAVRSPGRRRDARAADHW